MFLDVFGGKALVALVDRRFQAATKQRRDRTLLPGILEKIVAISRNLHCGLVTNKPPGRPKSAIQYPQAASQMAITRNATPKTFHSIRWHSILAKVDARLRSFSIEHFVQGQLVQRPPTKVELMGNV